MPIISNYTASGHEGDFSYVDSTTGITVSGKVSTDASDNLVTVSGSCSKTIEGTNATIGSFSIYFSNQNHALQDMIMDALGAAVGALYDELHPAQSSS